MSTSSTLSERFWKYVNKTDTCWLWTGARIPNGYGVLSNGTNEKGYPAASYAHKVSWELHNGPVQEGLHVLHRCDNRACVHIDHLFLGTAKDNTQDMLRKGRGRYQNGKNPDRCPKGHTYRNNSRRLDNGELVCILCRMLQKFS